MKRRIVWRGLGGLLLVAAVSLCLGYWLGCKHPSVVGTVVAQPAPQRPVRERPCSVSLVQGGYALNAGGALPSSDGGYAAVGILNFDGSGNLIFRVTQSFNGRIVPPTGVPGVYAINADCTGRIVLNTGALFDVVVADETREINLIQINADAVLRGVARKI